MSAEFDITTEAALREILPKGFASDDSKVLTSLDEHCRHYIERSPFLVIASRDAAGNMDVSPKGDPPGFVQVLDDNTIAIPERPGNRRCDTYTNVLAEPEVAVIFLVPGEDVTLRVMGRGSLTTDPALLESMAVNGRPALMALKIAISETFLHCGKAPKRAKLWDPAAQVEKGEFPRLGEMIHDQMAAKALDAGVSREQLGDLVDDDYANNVY